MSDDIERDKREKDFKNVDWREIFQERMLVTT
jgi:hypothetical protein